MLQFAVLRLAFLLLELLFVELLPLLFELTSNVVQFPVLTFDDTLDLQIALRSELLFVAFGLFDELAERICGLAAPSHEIFQFVKSLTQMLVTGGF